MGTLAEDKKAKIVSFFSRDNHKESGLISGRGKFDPDKRIPQ